MVQNSFSSGYAIMQTLWIVGQLFFSILQMMDTGACSPSGLRAPRPVMEVGSQGQDSAIVRPRIMVDVIVSV